jgi:hypothetical protein
MLPFYQPRILCQRIRYLCTGQVTKSSPEPNTSNDQRKAPTQTYIHAYRSGPDSEVKLLSKHIDIHAGLDLISEIGAIHEAKDSSQRIV